MIISFDKPTGATDSGASTHQEIVDRTRLLGTYPALGDDQPKGPDMQRVVHYGMPVT